MPNASCPALRGIVAALELTPVGSNVAVSSKAAPFMMLTVPLGVPPPPGMALTLTVRVVACPCWRVDALEARRTVNELETGWPVFWYAPMSILEPFVRGFPRKSVAP